MSTIRAYNIQHPDSAEANIQLGSDGSVTFPNDPMGLREIITFTSAGSLPTVYDFEKANYPWLRAMRVKCVGGGGSGGGATITGASPETSYSSGGSGADYAESLILASALAAIETVTVGAGGVGSAGVSGSAGGDTSFGSHVIAPGGIGGIIRSAISVTVGAAAREPNSTVPTGQVTAKGSASQHGFGTADNSLSISGGGGNAGGIGGGGGKGRSPGSSGSIMLGDPGGSPGGGGGGTCHSNDVASASAGGDGGPGLVIVELYG